jgi:hypothetical protein
MNARVLQIRSLIGDPIATSINYADPLPADALDGSVYTTGNGVYHVWRSGAWKPVKIQIDDAEIEKKDTSANIYISALAAINLFMARFNPLDYITSGNAGAQGFSFPTIESVYAGFNLKKAAIEEMAALSGNVLQARRRDVPVGGVYDWET